MVSSRVALAALWRQHQRLALTRSASSAKIDLATRGVLGRTRTEVGPALVTTGEPHRRAAGYRAPVEDRDRERGADADQVGDIHEGVDGRQLGLLDEASQERLRGRAVLGRVDAEAAEDATPGSQRRELAERPVTEPLPHRRLLVTECSSECRRGGPVRDAARMEDPSDDRRERLDDLRVVPEERHPPSLARRSRAGRRDDVLMVTGPVRGARDARAAGEHVSAGRDRPGLRWAATGSWR